MKMLIQQTLMLGASWAHGCRTVASGLLSVSAEFDHYSLHTPNIILSHNSDNHNYSTEKMSDYLTIADLKRLYLVTFDARIKWRNILLILDVPSATIHSIGKEWSNNPDDCYREGLIKWLNEGGKSWKEMVEALSSPIVSEVHIARTIEKDHPSAKRIKLQGKYQWHINT